VSTAELALNIWVDLRKVTNYRDTFVHYIEEIKISILTH
jgi:hypothetical protein